ncbi:MAG: ABC transporter ATP-binding protein [Burkholderiaceae bacterium]
MTTNDTPAIELRGVHMRYGGVEVLRAIDLRIAEGEFCVFVGPSGCGKSTLLRLVAGLEDASGGEILMRGRRVDALPPAERDVAMVFQSYALYPHMTVRQNMSFGLEYRKVARAEIDRRVQAASDMLQLGTLLDRKPRDLSGGQRQRVAIGRALVRQPAVFLFDEPLSNLDAALRVQTRVEIARLHRSLGTAAMVYVTHDQVEAMTLADRIVLLRPQAGANGAPSIAQVGPPLELYHRPANRFVAGFIGSPAMNFLPAIAVGEAGEGLALRVAGIECVAQVDPRPIARAAPVTAGIRPEHVRLGGDGPLRASVAHVERLGEHAWVYLQLPDGTPLVAKALDDRMAAGDQVALALPAAQLHVFGADGEAFPRRIEATAVGDARGLGLAA